MTFKFISEINENIDNAKAAARLVEKMTELYGAEIVEQIGLNEVSQAAMARAGEREWAQQASRETEKGIEQDKQQMKTADKITGTIRPDVGQVILRGGNQYVVKTVSGSRVNAYDEKAKKPAHVDISELKTDFTPVEAKDGTVRWMYNAELKKK